MASPSQNSTKNFIAKRIMLPIELNVYPIAIDEDCLACGVESLPHSTTSKSGELVPILVHSVARNNEVREPWRDKKRRGAYDFEP